MIARARVVAEADSDGVTRLTHLRSEAPLALRNTPGALYLVGAAAGPLGGDELELRITVKRGARLQIRSSAATMALPGPAGAFSRMILEAEVEPDALLRWLPEPTIAAAGCRHRTRAALVMATGSTIAWREELIMGRHDEAAGTIESRIDLTLGGHPLLRTELLLGPEHPGWDGPAGIGGSRAVGSMLYCAPHLGDAGIEAGRLGSCCTMMPLAGPAVYVSALARDATALRYDLDRAEREIFITPAGP